MKVSLRLLGAPETLLSTLAFVVAGGAATVAVATTCYVSNGMGWCCVPLAMDCYNDLGDEWTCISDSPAGNIPVGRVKAAPPGASGRTGYFMASSSCVWTTRTCGPEVNSCLDVSTTTMTCMDNLIIGLPCSGIEP